MPSCSCGPASSSCQIADQHASKVVVVPTAALQRGPNNITFVYVVQPDETVGCGK